MKFKKEIAITSDLRTFFIDEVQTISARQGFSVSEPTVIYMGELLERFHRSERYFVKSKDPKEKRQEFPSISLLWLESMATDFQEKIKAMKKVGDLALFTAGFFSERLQRRLVDLDYFMAVGERAYETAGHLRETALAERALNCFFELASKFGELSEVLKELNDQCLLATEQDQLRLYQKWLATQDPRIKRMLSESGIICSEPVKDRV